MAKHTPGEKKEYTPEFFLNSVGTVLENILKVMNKAREMVEGRWQITQTAFEMAVKYHDTPDGPERLDHLVGQVCEELWAKSYKLNLFETRDDRKACKAGEEAVKLFKESCK